jgi:hypothetical protein
LKGTRPFGIITRIEIDADDRIFFPFPVQGINGKRRLSRNSAKKIPAALKESPQSRTQQGFPETPGPGQKEISPRTGYEVVDSGGLVHITISPLPNLRKILYSDW